MIGKFFLTTALVVLLAGGAAADTTTKPLAPGVTLTQEVDTDPALIINVIEVDLTAPGVRLGVFIGTGDVNGPDGKGGRQTVSDAAKQHGALAAVNGDYFGGPAGDPLGIGVASGRLFSEPWWGDGKGGPRAAMAVVDSGHRVIFDTLGFLGDLQTADGARAPVAGVNRRVGANEIIAFTPLYGPTTGGRQGGTDVTLAGVNLPLRANKLMTGTVLSVASNSNGQSAIGPNEIVLSAAPGTESDFLTQHLKAGQGAEFVIAVAPPGSVEHAVQIAELPRTSSDLPSRAGESLDRSAWLWGATDNAVGGGPRLLTDGQITVDGSAEGFADWMISSDQPRTAVGAGEDGQHLFVVTVDGRQGLSRGVTLPELAAIMKRYGCWDAINLDGGGSTAMYAGGLTVDNPNGNGDERAVAETLEVFSDKVSLQPQSSPTPLTLAVPTNGTVTVGSQIPVKIVDGDKEISGSSSDVLWRGPVSGIGFMDQTGIFHAATPGTAGIEAIYRGIPITGRIVVVGASPQVSANVLSAQFAPNGTVNYDQLTIRILDQAGVPAANVPVHVMVTGGVADSADVTTGEDGYITDGVTWSAGSGGSVDVTSNGLNKVTVSRPQ